MMKLWILAIPIVLAGWAAAADAPPASVSLEDVVPPEPAAAGAESASPLERVIANEEETVAYVKRFDDEQQTLAKAEMEGARELSEKGQGEEAKARLAAAQERVKQVQALYDEVLIHYPKNAELRNDYGELLYDVFGNVPLGVKEWKTALSLDPDLSAAHNNLSIHYSHYGEYALALDHMDKALKLDGENPDYLFNVAQLYLAHGPQVAELRKWSKKKVYRKAMGYSEKAAQLAPADYDLQQDYAVNFFAAENFEVEADWKAAAEAWRTARATTERPDQVFYTWLNEGRVWLLAQKPELARPAIEQALAMRPDSEAARTLLKKAGGEAPAAPAAPAPEEEVQ